MNIVITGASYPTAVGIARSLRSLRPTLIGLCPATATRYNHSRYWDRLIQADEENYTSLDKLVALGRSFNEKSVLFPTSDKWVKLLSDNREALEQYYHFVLPDRGILDLLLDKTLFHAWAEEKGFALPRTEIADSAAEMGRIAGKVQYPCVLKPMYHVDRWYKVCPEKVYKVHSREEVLSLAPMLFRTSSRYVVQEYIPGPDRDLHFCLSYFDRQGRERGFYTGRKLIQWPVGAGTLGIGVGTDDEEVHRISKTVLSAAGSAGMCSLELKRDERDGKLYIIEPTVGRCDLQVTLAVAGGVNLPLIAYYDAIGSSRIVPTVRRQASWVFEYNLFKAVVHLRRNKKEVRGLLREGLSWRMSFATFSFSDPWPFLWWMGVKARKYFRRILPGSRSSG